MKLGYDLKIEQTQKLVMTPELIQAIQILQFNAQELDTFVSEQLMTNPVLESETDSNTEKKKEDSKEDFLQEHLRSRDFHEPTYGQRDYDKEKKENKYEQYVTEEISLAEHLMFQLQFASSRRACRRIGRFIIESLDDNGYMTSTEGEIAEILETPIDNVKKVLALIQTFDPVGVGARNLGECLLIQLEQQGRATEVYRQLLVNHMEDLADNRLSIIGKALDLSVQEVQEMRDEIRHLDPRPGRQFFNGVETSYIVPDIFMEKIEGEYVATINEVSAPRLMVSGYYQKVLAETQGKDETLNTYLSERVNAALWLIKSIEQRKQTIMNVVNNIISYQKEFFDHGEKFLKTLTLKQVAEELGIHESTVSRSINGKYIQSPRGVFELKYFFSAGVSDSEGEGIASTSIKTYIKEIIAMENEKAPYSDQKLVHMLKERDIEISRRTVAKYREEMGILSSSKRKRY